MPRRRLSPDEEALWNALARSIRPLPGRRRLAEPAPEPAAPPAPLPAGKRLTPPPSAPVTIASPRQPAAVLDSGWEKRIRGGAILPDMTIDLHGHTLSAAHARLDQAIAFALAQNARILLIVTGKPRKSIGEPGGSRRGAIRAEIGHWLETGRHADRIASVRVAHPRHGGDGALYVILRRHK